MSLFQENRLYMKGISLSKSQKEVVFIVALFIVPFLEPAFALLLGLFVSLTIGHPFLNINSRVTHVLLQISVVGLGFGMNVDQAIEAGKNGVLFTVVSIVVTLALGVFLTRKLKVAPDTGFLVSGGTAICGGSAIAALAPVIKAKDKDITVAMGTIFMLNAVALLIFPFIGRLLEMNNAQFGYWCAIAIHDTSSVVGAAKTFGEEALNIATTTKLIRALWIIPVSLGAAFFYNKRNSGRSKITIPYFIFLYVVAMVVATYIPQWHDFYTNAVSFAKVGMLFTLFLIGSGLSKETIKQVGFKPILLGIILWICISVLSASVILML